MFEFIEIEKIAEVNPKIPKTFSQKLQEKVTFLPMAGVSEEGKILFTQECLMNSVIKGYTYFEEGDILFAKITPCLENGKAVLLSSIPHKIGFGSTEFHVLRASDQVDSSYLFYMIWSPVFRKIAGRNMTGTAGQKRISSDFVKRFKIPLPPLEEQKRIAAILDKADAIRRKRQQAIALTEELLRSVFLDMFGDPVTNPKGWDVVKIGDLTQVKTGGTPSRQKANFYQGSIPWVKTTEVNNNVITYTEEYLTQEGLNYSNCKIFPVNTIIIAMYGQGFTRGRSAKLGIEATTNQACAAIIPSEKYDTDYLWSFMKLSYNKIRDLGRGGNQPNLNLDIVRNFEIFLPPLKLQKEFTEKITVIDNSISRQTIHKNILENLFNSLLQRAFKGEL